jgi:hypothetical protein
MEITNLLPPSMPPSDGALLDTNPASQSIALQQCRSIPSPTKASGCIPITPAVTSQAPSMTSAPHTQLPLELSSTPARNRQKESRRISQEQIKKSTVIGAVIKSKTSSEIYRVKRNSYVGKLRDLPPPQAIRERWEQEICFRLGTDLCQAVKALSLSRPDEDFITEPVLCMAGSKCSALFSADPRPPDPVLLTPTVWIHCGSRDCKKKVKHWIAKLSYLYAFLDEFHMPAPIVSLDAPFPAAEGSESANDSEGCENASSVSFAIEEPQSDTLCGARVRFTADTKQGRIERYSTIGGLVFVEENLYALTTAHGIVDCLRGSPEKCSTDSTQSRNIDPSSDSESVSDSGSSSFSESFESRVANIVRPNNENQRKWMNVDAPKIIAYMGRGTRCGDLTLPDTAPSCCDFALFEIRPFWRLWNLVKCSGVDEFWHLSEFVPSADFKAGDVTVVSSLSNTHRQGYLLQEESILAVKGTLVKTRKIQIENMHGMNF